MDTLASRYRDILLAGMNSGKRINAARGAAYSEIFEMLLEERYRRLLREQNAYMLNVARNRAAEIRGHADNAAVRANRALQDIEWVEKSIGETRNRSGRTAAAALSNFRSRLRDVEGPLLRRHQTLDSIERAQKVIDDSLQSITKRLGAVEPVIGESIRHRCAGIGAEEMRDLAEDIELTRIRLEVFKERKEKIDAETRERRRRSEALYEEIERRLFLVEEGFERVRSGLEDSHRHTIELLGVLK